MRNTFLLLTVLLQVIISSAQSSTFLIPYRIGNRWGFSDTLGKIMVQPKYDSTAFLLQGYQVEKGVGRVYASGKTGLVSATGAIRIPIVYNEVEKWQDQYRVRKGSKWGLYTKAGKLVVPVEYDNIENADYNASIQLLELKGKFGLYHPGLHKILPAEYDFITSEFYTETLDLGKWFYARKGTRKLLISKATLAVTPYKGKEDPESEELMKDVLEISQEMEVEDNEEKDIRSIKDHFGAEWVKPYVNTHHGYMLNVKAYQYRKEGKYGLAFGNTLPLMQPLYDSVTYTMSVQYNNQYLPKKSYYLLAVKKGRYFGLINEGNEEILPFQYDLITSMPGFAQAFEVRKEGKRGVFLPNTFYPLIQPQYDTLEYLHSLEIKYNWSFVIFRVTKNGKPGYVGENGVEYFK